MRAAAKLKNRNKNGNKIMIQMANINLGVYCAEYLECLIFFFPAAMADELELTDLAEVPAGFD
jgi:diphthamide synthase (EF-2-diphthine--ammonia ligase)